MIFYEFLAEYEENTEKEMEEEPQENYEKKLGIKMNKALRILRQEKAEVAAYVYSVDKERIALAVTFQSELEASKAWKLVAEALEHSAKLHCVLKQSTEITAERFRGVIAEGDGNNLLLGERRIMKSLKLDYDENYTFKVSEELFLSPKQTLKAALRRAEDLMVASDYVEEIRRIYSKDNVKRFWGHPVHYHLVAGNEESADAMQKLLIASLQSNNRLISGRISHVFEVTERCYDEADFEKMIRNSQGSTVVLSLNYAEDTEEEYASTYNEVVHFVAKLIKKYHRRTLFIFREISERKNYAKSLINEVCEELRIVEMSEGTGSREQALVMLRQMMADSQYRCFKKEGDEEAIPKQDSYKLSEIYGYYNEWVEQVIYQRAYRTYAVKKNVEVKKEKKAGTSYEKLQEMVGLEEIKDLVDRIVAMHRIQKLRFEMGMEQQRNSMHMIFTGNPGSAKTTVARLLTSILKEEGILRNGNLVECGRSDLVGKYVGWTAVQVKKKFKEAMGGVLFIDEAYALVDERSGSFGDEAIHTLVQEMENHREDVIVILAGYPKRMQQFLDKNEGLRSRIAFHLDFPDYTAEEMLAILKLMMKEKRFCCEEETLEKCRRIFEGAVTQAEFGNGRYARNLLEQAMMKQSQRLVASMQGKEVSEEEMMKLMPEDFEVLLVNRENHKKRMGF